MRVSTTAYANEGIGASIASLPLHQTTNVRVEAFGRDVFLFLNNSYDSMVTVSAERVYGEATLYVSDPWYPPALASIGSIQMKSISSLSFKERAASDFNGLLSQLAVYEKTTVPANYSLSFDITPTDYVSRSASIIRYSQDKTDNGKGGRIPGMYLTNN